MNYIKKTLQAGKHSLAGLSMAFKYERAVRVESVIFIPLIFFALFMNFQSIEKILLILPIMLIFSCELFNSALEKTIDELGNGKVCNSFKFAKDVSSAAVLLMIIMTLISWTLIGYPYITAHFV